MSLADTYIVFELDNAAYAVRSVDVQHVEMLEHVTRVPNTAAAVDGVVFSRGQVFPAINLRARFGLPRQPYTPKTRLIFLKVQNRVVALIVDTAREFQRIPAEAIRPIEQTLVGIQGNHVEGVATVKGRSVLILNVGVVLTLEEITTPEIPGEAAGVSVK
jgi:purine-binding chemotaxis protein CheW